jgi:hypothetical protein
VARIVLGGMLFLAAITLVFALATTKYRRSKDNPKDPTARQPPTEVRSLPPAEWAGIAYLPDDTHAVAGVRLAAALDSEAGRALLGPLGLAPGAAGQGRMFGLTSGEVDHLVLSASLRALPPRITAVVRTQQALNADWVSSSIPGGRSVERNGKTLTQGKLWAGGPEGVVGPVDDRSLIVTLLPRDFDKLPAAVRPGVSRFADPLPDLLVRRVDPAALVWLAAYAEANNDALGFVTGLLPLPPAERDAWARIEALAVSVRADGPKLVLTAALRGRDVATSDALAAAIVKSLATAGLTAERTADGHWRTLTATADAAALANWLTGLRGRQGP